MTNLIGQSLGRYHILEQLGEGGMATVYKAFDTRLERNVAIKVIRQETFPPNQLDRILKRFEREAKSLAKLSHPNIVGVIDYGDYEGSPYLVMEFLPGGTLKDRLGKSIPWQESVQLLLPVARALQYAHGQGIIHRDIKPSNILITHSGEPMLADFGIAKILENGEATTLTGTGIGVGTPEYMAPEQWTGNATEQSDLYSLGIVFYEMITGRKPYMADTPAAILLKQNNDPLPRPKSFVPDLPEFVEKVLFKALARKQEDRYPDISTFSKALGVILKEAIFPSVTKRGKRATLEKDTSASMGKSTCSQPNLTVISEKKDRHQAASSKKFAQEGTLPKPAATRLKSFNRFVRHLTSPMVVILITLCLGVFLISVAIQAGLLSPEENAIPATEISLPLATKTPVTAANTRMPSPTVAGSSASSEMPMEIVDPRRDVISDANLASFVKMAEWTVLRAVSGVAISPDDTLLAVGYGVADKNDPSISIVNANTGEIVHTMSGQKFVCCLVFSPDGSELLTAGANGDIKIWSVADGSLVCTINAGSIIHSLDISIDGKTIAAGLENGMVRTWRRNDGVPLLNFNSEIPNRVDFVTYSPDGSYLAAATTPFPDRYPVRLWRLPSYFQSNFGFADGSSASSKYVSISPDGEKIAAYLSNYNESAMVIWKTSNGQQLAEFQGIYGEFDPHWSVIINSSGFYSVEDGRKLASFSDFVFIDNYRSFFSADGKYFISGGYDAVVRIYGVG